EVEKSSEDVVIVDYEALANVSEILPAIEEAFGSHPHCLGLLLVKNLPAEYPEMRLQLLRLASLFASLPDDIKEKFVDVESKILLWMELWQRINEWKTWANPLLDVPIATKEQIEKFPFYCHPNIWPTEYLPEFEDTFKKLDNIQDDRLDTWCGWHIDNSCLRGLTSSMYIDERDRSLAESKTFQMGEAMQIAFHGAVMATKHMVKGISRNIDRANNAGDVPFDAVSRNTFAFFMQPSLEERVGNVIFDEFS
ncbi:12150_t:CDS:2, partial [Ambispora leptoticha]